MQRDDICCTGACQQGRQCPLYRAPRKPKRPGRIALVALAALRWIGQGGTPTEGEFRTSFWFTCALAIVFAAFLLSGALEGAAK